MICIVLIVVLFVFWMHAIQKKGKLTIYTLIHFKSNIYTLYNCVPRDEYQFVIVR